MWGSRDGYIRDAQRKRFITESYSTPASRAVSGVGETTTLDEVLSPESGMNSVKNIVAREGGFSQNSIVRAPTHSPTLRVASGARLHGSYKKVFPRVQEQRLRLDRRPRAPSTREARRHPPSVLRRRRTAGASHLRGPLGNTTARLWRVCVPHSSPQHQRTRRPRHGHLSARPPRPPSTATSVRFPPPALRGLLTGPTKTGISPPFSWRNSAFLSHHRNFNTC